VKCHICLYNICRIIHDYVVREDGYTLRPATTSAHSNKVIKVTGIFIYYCYIVVNYEGCDVVY